MEPYIPVSPETPPINVEVPGEDLGPTVTAEEDGGVTVDFGETVDEEGAAPEHSDNLAEYMDDGDLHSRVNRIDLLRVQGKSVSGSRVCENYQFI